MLSRNLWLRVARAGPRAPRTLSKSGRHPAWAAILVALTLPACTPADPPADPGGSSPPSTAGAAESSTRGLARVARTDRLDLSRPISTGFLLVDGVYNSELMAPYDIFQHTVYHTQPGMETFTVSPDGEAVVTAEGLTITPHHSFEDAPPIDVLVVPSAVGSMDADLQNEVMMDWVARVGAEASYVVSLCDGAFVLAAAGLLEGREVTTFPGDQDRFAEAFPKLHLRRGATFVHDGPALTSEGGAKSYDVAMYLVDHLYGEQVARGVGGGLIIRWPPVSGWDAIVVEPSPPASSQTSRDP